MKERPILFSAPMVRALLDGRKTQTRRIVKPQPHEFFVRFGRLYDHPKKLGEYSGELVLVNSPYGQPRDRLWVKETHAFIWPDEYEPENLKDCNIEYRADTDGKALPGDWPEESRDDPERPKWRPSIFMHRWASRILLEITAVRVERLQDISEEDAIAEGAKWGACGAPQIGSHKAGYAQLWESINGAGSWDANPWVWVVEFKKIGANQ